MNKEWLGIAQCLETHPILKEKTSYKIKYLNVLEYFVQNYSKDDIFANKMVEIYIEKFIGKDKYFFNSKKVANDAFELKFKGYKLFSYRDILLFDCCFINAFNDKQKAKMIKNKIADLFHNRYHKRINLLYSVLYYDEKSNIFSNLSEQIFYWDQNKNFLKNPVNKVLITANMSAGKSTLINALIGKKINRTQNDACTAKIHYIYNKPFEDGYSYEWDYELNLNADQKTLLQDNPNNNGCVISVGTFFRTSEKSNKRICIIDTPGVNSSQHKNHKELTEYFIRQKDYDKLVFVLNARNIGTFDDLKHLTFVFENVKDKPIIFVVNQLDTYNSKEDALDETIAKVRSDLTNIGFKNPEVYPISAYAALLAKKKIWNEKMSEDEWFELEGFRRKFNKKEFDLSQHTESVTDEPQDDMKNLLFKTGFNVLEKIIVK